jgi:GNAT superfamily N-acetyltransferase
MSNPFDEALIPSVPYTVVPIADSLRGIVQPLIDDAWAGPHLAVNGKLWDTRTLPGLAALDGENRLIGYLLYTFHGGECEIMVLESLHAGIGVGTRLIERVKEIAKKHNTKKLIVMTTNDNIKAIRFYQKRGFTLRRLRPNMLAVSRRLKPGIPLTGNDGLPLRDEIEFEIEL